MTKNVRERVYFLEQVEEKGIYVLFGGCFQKSSAPSAVLYNFLNRQDMVMSNFVLIFAKFSKKWGIVLANFVRERVSFS